MIRFFQKKLGLAARSGKTVLSVAAALGLGGWTDLVASSRTGRRRPPTTGGRRDRLARLDALWREVDAFPGVSRSGSRWGDVLGGDVWV